MIRLRAWIGRSLEHPWLAVFVLLALAILLVLTALHSLVDDAVESITLICAAIALLASVVVVAFEQAASRNTRVGSSRAPPPLFQPVLAPSSGPRPALSLPLRR